VATYVLALVAGIVSVVYVLFQIFHNPAGNYAAVKVLLGLAILGAGVEIWLGFRQENAWATIGAGVGAALVAWGGDQVHRAKVAKDQSKSAPPPKPMGQLLTELLIAGLLLAAAITALP